MRVAWCLVLAGCVEGVGPVIAYGSQATEHGEAKLGFQLGGEATLGLPIAGGTVGAYWIQSHGFAFGEHFNLGFDGAYKAASAGGFGGGFELGGLWLADDVKSHELLGMTANASVAWRAIRCQDDHRIPPPPPQSSTGWSWSLAISLRWNPRGLAVVLAPRIVAYQLFCPDNAG